MNKIVLITGATSGIGLACAHTFAAAGYDVIGTGRRAERLAALKDTLESTHSVRFLPLAFDVRERQVVFDSIGSLPSDWQAVDILINNAGLALGRDYFEEASMEDWETMIDTNIKGLLYVSRAVLPYMTARGTGHIINLGSTAGKEVYEKGNVYCATKFSVGAISQAMRIDLLRHGIKVTCIHPGAVETEFSLVRFKGDAGTAGQVYSGIQPLTGEDVAGVIYYTTTLPAHVCVNELVLTCTQQANSMYTLRR
jgi:3-hydroxy acid dehydrogenase / malonic semialdehyde reductase